MLEQWIIFVAVLLFLQDFHMAVFKMMTLPEASKEVNFRLRSQATVQQDMTAALIILVQTDFNNSFFQVFASHLPVT